MAEKLSFSAAEALDILRAAGLEAELRGSPAASYSGATLDSRKAAAGMLFVALRGEKADGHDFAIAALQAGARVLLLGRAALAERPDLGGKIAAASAGTPIGAGSPAAALVVPSVLPAFQALARAKRMRHPGLLRVGITGSSGKTTTKEIVASVLSRAGKVAMNPGNLNSDQGLALSLFGIEGDERFGVFEMGMNRRGEMDELAAMYEPDFALITNVGTAHIGILGSRQAIAEEKKKIFSRFDGRQVGFVREDEDFGDFLAQGVRGEIVKYGVRSTAGFAGAEDLGLDGWAIDWEGLQIRFPLVGRHNLDNALAALSLAARMGIRAAEAAAGLEAVRPLFGRSEIVRGRATVVRDCYNANPESVEAAIGFCDELSWKGRKLYVLGSMLELGLDSEVEHRRVGEAAGRSRADALCFFGEEMRTARDAARDSGFAGFLAHETDIDLLGRTIAGWLREGDLVLLKASRGMALERVMDAIQG